MSPPISHLIVSGLFAAGMLTRTVALADDSSAPTVNTSQRVTGAGMLWTEQRTTASDGVPGAAFGSAVSVQGPVAIIAADGEHNSRGSAYVFDKTEGIWTEGQKLLAEDGANGDEFGYRAVLEDDTLVITSFSKNNGDNTAQGAAYVFANDGKNWSQAQKLLADDGAIFDNFGASATLDGDTLIIGANGATVGKNPAQGAAYVFTRSGGAWQQQQKLTADDGEAYNNYGFSTAVKGSIAFIGSKVAAIDGNAGQGAVYQYVKSGNVWSPIAKLVSSDGAAWDAFGEDLTFDGSRLLVSAPGNAGRGAVYVFVESDGNWVETQKLVAGDGTDGDSFGNRVVLHGSRALIAADIATVDGNTSRGKTYLFIESDGVWSQAHTFVASDGGTDDFFGSALAFDGDTALIATLHSPNNTFQGAAYFYTQETIFADGFDGDSP